MMYPKPSLVLCAAGVADALGFLLDLIAGNFAAPKTQLMEGE
jgi:hypothetical protein